MTLELHILAEAGLLTLLVIFLLLGASLPKPRPWERMLTGSSGRFPARDRQLIRLFFQGKGDANADFSEPMASQAIEKEEGCALILPPDAGGVPLPRRLERRLARMPEGLKRLRVGRDVMLIELHTGQILDVIKGVFPEAEAVERRPSRTLLTRRRHRNPVSDHSSSLSS